jgi:hypothetical protein
MLLPTKDNAGTPYPDSFWQRLKRDMVERFGGVTAYTRAPAEGVWSGPADGAKAEDICIVEVMVSQIDEKWWHRYRADLENDWAQQKVVVRATPFVEL